MLLLASTRIYEYGEGRPLWLLGRNFRIRRQSIVATVARFPSMETRGARRNDKIDSGNIYIYVYIGDA